MHPQVQQFVEQFQREAIQNGSFRQKLGRAELLFLEEIWGPEFQYKFEGLKAEYPFKDLKGGQRFADFVYIRNGLRLVIEIDGFTTHARDISPADFDDHLARQNDLMLSGWLVLRFSAHQVERRPHVCRRQLKQAIGHGYSLTQSDLAPEDANMWKLRKQLVIQLALRQQGKLRPWEVASAFRISSRSASKWLKRFSTEGDFSPAAEGVRTKLYRLNHYPDSQHS